LPRVCCCRLYENPRPVCFVTKHPFWPGGQIVASKVEKLTVDLELNAEAHPGKFNSRIGNKFYYARAGVSEYLTRQSKKLSKHIEVEVSCDTFRWFADDYFNLYTHTHKKNVSILSAFIKTRMGKNQPVIHLFLGGRLCSSGQACEMATEFLHLSNIKVMDALFSSVVASFLMCVLFLRHRRV